MKTLTDAETFRLRPGVADDSTITLFGESDTEQHEADLLVRLENLPSAMVLAVDFSGVRIASAAARRLLRRPMLRIASGELPDRFIVLEDLGESLYSVEAMLSGEQLMAVERTADGPVLRGDVDPAALETYEALVAERTMTANALKDRLSLSSISAATNRLTNLAKRGLAWRLEQRPAAGGGREYIYAPVR
ncbi:MAG: hypothetical protein ACYC3F_09495 [Gemmatimonadaceae bacterium]